MDRQTIIRSSIAASIAAAGLTVGGVAIATADDSGSSDSKRSEAVAGMHFGERGDRMHGHGHRGPIADGALAEKLGVSESELREAMLAIRGEIDRPERGEMRDEAAREEMKAELATALAAELDLSADDITAAFDELKAEFEGERRDALSERLDEAVDAGDLTDGDKASVLKAFDAGVLRPHGPR